MKKIKFYSWGQNIYEIAEDVNRPIKSFLKKDNESYDEFHLRAMKGWGDFKKGYKPKEEIHIIETININDETKTLYNG